MQYGINPIQMYKDNGYAAYSVASSSQSPWQSLYYIKEACKTQPPKMVILDTYKMATPDYRDYQTVNNLLNAPLSIDKCLAVMESIADSRLSVLFRFPYIHDDYNGFKGFGLDKFYGIQLFSMGYSYNNNIDTSEQELYSLTDARDITESEAISEKDERSLRKIIEYCKANDIEVILINAPWPMIEKYRERKFNYIKEIASEYDVRFIDGNICWNEMGIDWTTDTFGDYGHMNHYGVTKFTKYVDSIIDRDYSLPDRRNDSGYEAYDKGVDWLLTINSKNDKMFN